MGEVLPRTYPDLIQMHGIAWIIPCFCDKVGGGSETVKRTGQVLSHRAKSFYTFKPCDSIPSHHSKCSTILNTDTHRHTYIHTLSWLLSFLHNKVGRACRQPDAEQVRSLDSVCACVFLGTDHVDKEVLSWRLRGEAMAGGRLAHTPQCDQQGKTFIVDIIVQTQNCTYSQMQFWPARNGHHLYIHV